jgi:sugar lactone lactonase YvrE
MPVKRPTSLAFAGSELKTLIVTSADLDDPILPRLPNVIQDGDVLAFDVDVPGVVLPAYCGSFLQDLKKSNDKL